MPRGPNPIDSYDRGFINALTALQKEGLAKNIAAIEDYLSIPKRTLYQVLNGGRTVPLKYRHVVMKFFTDNYNVNPKVFANHLVPVFVGGEVPKMVDESFYIKKSEEDARWTMGDARELQRLREETKAKTEEIKELKKELKYWRDMGKKFLSGDAGKGLKKGQKRGKKGGNEGES